MNTSSIYLVGAGDAAPLGFLWLAVRRARNWVVPYHIDPRAFGLVP